MKKIDLTTYERPSKFLKFEIGDNRIRLLSDGYMFHVVGKRTAKGFVRAMVEPDVDLPKFLEDATPKLTYGWIALDQAKGIPKILETGIMLGDQLAKLTAEKPEEYKALDIIVTKKKTGPLEMNVEYTAKWSTDHKKLPAGLTMNSPEFKVLIRHFENPGNKK